MTKPIAPPAAAPILALLIVLLPACTSAAQRARDEAARAPLARHAAPLSQAPIEPGVPVEGTEEPFFRAGRVVIGAQPTKADLARFRAEGVGTVINLRSTAEAEAGYDEAAAARRLGMGYQPIPLGGDDGYEPADVEVFARALAACEGEALIHCASGGRARAMVSAWLITHRGWTPEQARAWRRTAGEKPDVLERLLGEDPALPG